MANQVCLFLCLGLRVAPCSHAGSDGCFAMQLADWLQVPLQPSAVRLWAAVDGAGGCAAELVYKVLVSASPALLTQLCRWHPMVTAEHSSK